MNSLLNQRIAERFNNSSDAARALYDALKGRKALGIGLTSLTTYLTYLVKGTRQTWWRRNPSATEKLAELLDLDVDDLFTLGERGVVPAASQWQFREFPSLKPLRPGELVCSIHGDGGLLPNASSQPHRWIVVPAGAGKSLALWDETASGRSAAHDAVTRSVTAIHELLSEPRTDRPLVVEVGDPDPEHDVETLRALSMRTTPITVLAAFKPPRNVRRRTHRDRGWDVSEARLRADWRRRLTGWIANRLPHDNHLFDEGEIATWLEGHDPEQRYISTPSELLSLCSVAFAQGLPKAKGLTVIANRWLSAMATHVLPDNETDRRWLRQLGPTTLRALVTARFTSADLSDEARTVGEWATLLPDAAVAAPEPDQIRTKLLELAKTKPASARKKAVDALVPDLARQPRRQVISTLREHGLLRTDHSGNLDLFPRWVAEALRRERIVEALKKGAIASWGAWAATASRTASVDAALDALDAPSFAGLVERVVAAGDGERTLGVVAAIEATFAAVARRAAVGGSVLPDEKTLQRLGLAQVDSLVNPYPEGFAYRLPMTRFRVADSDAIDRWLCAGWAFSLRVGKPARFDRPDLAWQLPGWATNLSLAGAPSPFPCGGSANASGIVRTLETLSQEVVARCVDKELPADIKPLLLIPAMMLAAPARGWIVRAQHLRAIANCWEGAALAWRIGQLPEAERREHADRLWPTAIDFEQRNARGDAGTALSILAGRFPTLFEVLTENVSLSVFESTIADRGFATLPDVLRVLPPRLRRSAVSGWARSARGVRDLIEVREMLAAADVIDVELLIDLGRQTTSGIAADYYEAIWERAPERALEETVNAIRAASTHTSAWCWSAPRSVTPAILDEIERCSTPPEWAFRWALRRLADGGALATRLYAIVSRGQTRAAK